MEKVNKLLAAGFIREVYYLDWLANVVLVKKVNGKWRMCGDFTNLNKTYLKDSFPLPRIDQLVDSTVGHKLLTFGRILRVQLDKNGRGRLGENCLHHKPRALLLHGDALWAEKCRGNPPEVSKQNFQ